MVTRRRIVLALAAGAIAAPVPRSLAQPRKTYAVGVFGRTSSKQRGAFEQGLRDHGWIDGKNIIVHYRTADGSRERVLEIVRELVDLKVDCIVASGNQLISMLKPATSVIPIVMAYTADAVGSGFVANLRRPGGNITGLTNVSEELTGKRLELLKALDTRMSRVAILKNPTIAAHNVIWKQAQSSAQALGMQVFAANYSDSAALEGAFATITKQKADGLMVPQSPIVVLGHARILGFTMKTRLPAIYQSSAFVEEGGLMSYGADQTDMWRRSAAYVDKILNGAKPGDLPVEQPTKLELLLNLKTAKALGINIPQSLLQRADRLIE